MKSIYFRAVLLGGLIAAAAPAVAAIDKHRPQDDAAIAFRGQSVTIDVLANDPDIVASTRLLIVLPPATGTAAVSNRRVVYTPAPGFSGRDSFSYMVKTGRRTGFARVTVDVRDGITLAGRVTDTASGGATTTVLARVGTEVFQSQAAADGTFQIGITGESGDMVRLESHSAGIALASIVGPLGRLAAEAGPDGVLTRGENSRVQLTPVSSALAYLLQLANEGAPVADEDRFRAAHDAMDIAVLGEMAAAVRLVADGDFALPDGVADTMALISDTDAYREFVDGVRATGSSAFNDALDDILADPEVALAAGQGDFAGGRTALMTAAPGTIRTGTLLGERLELAVDGTGRFLLPSADPVTGLAWQLDDGGARVMLDQPRIWQSTYVVRDGQQVLYTSSLDGFDVRLLDDAGATGRQLLGVTEHYTYAYPDNPEYPDVHRSFPFVTLWYLDGIEIPFQPGEFPATRGLAYAGASGPYAVHQFDAGGGSVLDDGQGFTWSLDGGRLQVTYDDGSAAEFRRILQDARKGDGVLGLFALADGSGKSHYSLSTVRDGSLVFDAAAMVGAWRSGIDVSKPIHDFTDHGIYVVLEEDGTGFQVHVDEHGTARYRLVWWIEEETLVMRRYQLNGRQFFERRWVPLARDGDRIYVHEEQWSNSSFEDPPQLMLLSRHANFFDLVAPPGP